MSDDLVKMCRRLSKYDHAQLSSTDLERIADRIEELEAKLKQEIKETERVDRVWSDNYAELKAKLAKAVEALDHIVNTGDAASSLDEDERMTIGNTDSQKGTRGGTHRPRRAERTRR